MQQVFHWTREALLRPLEPGSVVVAFSSGAAVAGSPLSGGYAGAKATIRFMASYAAEESERSGLGIRFVSVLPQLTPATDLGATAVGSLCGQSRYDGARTSWPPAARCSPPSRPARPCSASPPIRAALTAPTCCPPPA